MNKNIVSTLSLADSFTITNGLLGLFSIFFIVYGKIQWAFAFILLAVLADGMDGITARKYGSFLGKYMDEFSDTISFCVAPLVMVFWKYNISFALDAMNALTLTACSVFLIGGVLHLIRYHIGKEEHFVGITTPASAIIVISLSFLSFPQWSVVLSLFLLSVLTVVNVPYPRIEGIFSIPAVILIFLAIIFGEKYYATLLLLLGTVIYALIGPFYSLKIKKVFKKLPQILKEKEE